MKWMVSASLVTELLTKLEVEKDQWIYDAIKRFDGETYAENLELSTTEERILEIKNSEHSMYQQKKLDLERMELELNTLEEDVEENQRSLEDLEPTLDVLQKELAAYESGAKSLDEIQFEKFRCGLDDQFTFDKKDQVVFKERRISKLMGSYQLVESDMLDFYQRQLAEAWLLLTRSIETIASAVKFDFVTNPPVVEVDLKHGRGLDQYLKPGNFEEDYWIALGTLEWNNSIVYEYYLSQINQFQRNAKEELMQLWDRKHEQKRLADEKVLELQVKNRQMKERMVELKNQVGRAKPEWEQGLLRPKLLEDILKEEFVRAVSGWQEKLLARDASDEERWAYHQYSQIILKQAERIIGNETF
ncbi:hypothetical protein [Neobacillus niacini]|uniref:hypothetical protein n=1 Tax=Neobacillus niacini TaxID=86668 RepID=UPI0020419634|nr:hypothetical protein [Neobacillus niacini]MCM3693318.1 hypothetical protein [Neobacillus niacini]